MFNGPQETVWDNKSSTYSVIEIPEVHCILNFFIGILSLRLKDDNLPILIRDATKLAIEAINHLRKKGKLTPPPSSCDERAGLWKTGDNLYKYDCYNEF